MPRIKRAGYNWSQVPIWMTCDHDLSDGAARLFCYLDWRAGDGSAFPSLATIARDLGKSEDSVRRNMRELEALGYVTTSGRPGRSSIYTVHHDVRTDKTPKPDQQQNSDPPQKCNPTPRKNATPPPANLPPITRDSNERIEPELAHADACEREASSATTQPSEKKERAQDIPAAVAYHEITHRWPPRAAWPELRAINGNGPLWAQVVKAYVMQGWNPANIAGMLEFYARGEVPGRPGAAVMAPANPEAYVNVDDFFGGG